MRKLPIKTERDVECRLKVKMEPSESHGLLPVQTQNKSNTIPSNWQAEKKNLVEKIVALKAENDKNLLALKKVEAGYSTLLSEKQKIEQIMLKNVTTLLEQKNHLESELSQAKRELNDVKTADNKIICDLKRERQQLLARIKQYQAGMGQQQSSTKLNNESSQEYEVEAILKHKDTTNGRQFLIRWKGYDSSEDTWEGENNLKCPTVLNKYLRSSGLKRKQNPQL